MEIFQVTAWESCTNVLSIVLEIYVEFILWILLEIFRALQEMHAVCTKRWSFRRPKAQTFGIKLLGLEVYKINHWSQKLYWIFKTIFFCNFESCIKIIWEMFWRTCIETLCRVHEAKPWKTIYPNFSAIQIAFAPDVLGSTWWYCTASSYAKSSLTLQDGVL